jgi:hypothetical protein
VEFASLIAQTSLLKGFFNGLKHGERRRSGRKVLGQDMEDLPPAAALTQNLQQRDYIEILCGTTDQLPKIFAELDACDTAITLAQSDLQKQTETASLSKNDQSFVRQPFIGEAIQSAASSRAPEVEAGQIH